MFRLFSAYVRSNLQLFKQELQIGKLIEPERSLFEAQIIAQSKIRQRHSHDHRPNRRVERPKRLYGIARGF